MLGHAWAQPDSEMKRGARPPRALFSAPSRKTSCHQKIRCLRIAWKARSIQTTTCLIAYCICNKSTPANCSKGRIRLDSVGLSRTRPPVGRSLPRRPDIRPAVAAPLAMPGLSRTEPSCIADWQSAGWTPLLILTNLIAYCICNKSTPANCSKGRIRLDSVGLSRTHPPVGGRCRAALTFAPSPRPLGHARPCLDSVGLTATGGKKEGQASCLSFLLLASDFWLVDRLPAGLFSVPFIPDQSHPSPVCHFKRCVRLESAATHPG